MFKRRNSAASKFSDISEVDLNIRKSKNQYQVLSTLKQPFKTSDLSKHLIKNLQMTINVLTDQKENEKADTEEVSETSTQKKSVGHSFLEGSHKPDKRKGKDIRDQSSRRKISPASGGGDDDDSSSSEEEPERRKLWNPKPYQKISVPTGDNAQEQVENRKRIVAEWMIKGQTRRGKPITTLKSFSGKVGEDPTSFLENLVIDAEANGWDETNLLEVIGEFLKDDARE